MVVTAHREVASSSEVSIAKRTKGPTLFPHRHDYHLNQTYCMITGYVAYKQCTRKNCEDSLFTGNTGWFILYYIQIQISGIFGVLQQVYIINAPNIVVTSQCALWKAAGIVCSITAGALLGTNSYPKSLMQQKYSCQCPTEPMGLPAFEKRQMKSEKDRKREEL